jgi:hypothetical protein
MLHFGGARTALFNYLFARHHDGEIVLRVEDTDRTRSSREFERSQLDDLAWLGLSFDEGPFRQSERENLYEEAVQRLSGANLIYEAEDEAGRRALYFQICSRSGNFRDALRGEGPFCRRRGLRRAQVRRYPVVQLRGGRRRLGDEHKPRHPG